MKFLFWKPPKKPVRLVSPVSPKCVGRILTSEFQPDWFYKSDQNQSASYNPLFTNGSSLFLTNLTGLTGFSQRVEKMNQQEMINAIARKLYHATRQDVAEVIDIMLEVWRDELARPDGSIYLTDMGRLYVECQHIPVTGAVWQTLVEKRGVECAPTHIPRLYFRFNPADRLKQFILKARSLDHE